MAAKFLKDSLVSQIEYFFRKAQRLFNITKLATNSNLLGRLNEYVDSIKNEKLFNNLSTLLDNYLEFLEESGEHKLNKNLIAIGQAASEARSALNNIAIDSYIDLDKDGFFQEEEDFDADNFLILLQEVSNDILNTLDMLGNVPEFDSNLEEIQNEFSQISPDKYDRNLRIIDREKQRNAKDVWIASNPAKYLSQIQRGWHNIKSDPKRHEQYKEKKRNSYRKFINDLTERAQTDPEAKGELDLLLFNSREKEKGRWKEKREIDRVKNKRHKDEWGKFKSYKDFSPEEQKQYEESLVGSDLAGYNIQTLRNKFVVAAARDEALRIAAKINNKSIQNIKTKMDKSERQKLIELAKQEPDYINFVANLPLTLEKNQEFKAIKSVRPDIAAEILKSITRLRKKN
jgi:hypothetical protein